MAPPATLMDPEQLVEELVRRLQPDDPASSLPRRENQLR